MKLHAPLWQQRRKSITSVTAATESFKI